MGGSEKQENFGGMYSRSLVLVRFSWNIEIKLFIDVCLQGHLIMYTFHLSELSVVLKEQVIKILKGSCHSNNLIKISLVKDNVSDFHSIYSQLWW